MINYIQNIPNKYIIGTPKNYNKIKLSNALLHELSRKHVSYSIEVVFDFLKIIYHPFTWVDVEVVFYKDIIQIYCKYGQANTIYKWIEELVNE